MLKKLVFFFLFSLVLSGIVLSAVGNIAFNNYGNELIELDGSEFPESAEDNCDEKPEGKETEGDEKKEESLKFLEKRFSLALQEKANVSKANSYIVKSTVQVIYLCFQPPEQA